MCYFTIYTFNISIFIYYHCFCFLQKPKSVQLYNQIGNFWRIKGDAQRSIECFRRALAVSPHNAEVLLNLARVLLVLQYLDDATYLARRSLELQPPDRSAWEQYLTLGQIFKVNLHHLHRPVITFFVVSFHCSFLGNSSLCILKLYILFLKYFVNIYYFFRHMVTSKKLLSTCDML